MPPSSRKQHTALSRCRSQCPRQPPTLLPVRLVRRRGRSLRQPSARLRTRPCLQRQSSARPGCPSPTIWDERPSARWPCSLLGTLVPLPPRQTAPSGPRPRPACPGQAGPAGPFPCARSLTFRPPGRGPLRAWMLCAPLRPRGGCSCPKCRPPRRALPPWRRPSSGSPCPPSTATACGRQR